MAITSATQLAGSLLLPPSLYARNTTNKSAAGTLGTMFYTGPVPAAPAAPAPGLAGQALTSYAGQIPFPAAVAGQTVYLAQLQGYVSSSNAQPTLLVDRLWHNSGVVMTTTTAQTIDSVTWPARDRNGATSGDGVMVALEWRTASTNAGAVTTVSMSYTNSAGTAGRTATIPTIPANVAANAWFDFTLQAGDTGVQSIQSVTLGTSFVTGAMHMVAHRIVASLNPPTGNIVPFNYDAWQLGCPVMYDNSVPFLLANGPTTQLAACNAAVTYAQG
jgi:hypothetical protein